MEATLDSHVGEADWRKVPAAARICTLILDLLALVFLVTCLTLKIQKIKYWGKIPLNSWFIIVIYIDAACFIVSTTLLSKSYSLDHSVGLCKATILLCDVLYFSTKIIIYLFFVEKVRVVRNPLTPRLKDKIYLFNYCLMTVVIVGLIVLLSTNRINELNNKNECIIGYRGPNPWLIVAADAVVNIWLTSLFLQPIINLRSFKNKTNSALRALVQRTFVGMCATIAATMANIITIGVWRGERAWLCLMVCTIDIMVCTVGLHWASSVDSMTGSDPIVKQDFVQGSHTYSARSAMFDSTRSTAVPPSIEGPDDLPDFDIEYKAALTTTSTPCVPARGLILPDIETETLSSSETRTEERSGPCGLEKVSD